MARLSRLGLLFLVLGSTAGCQGLWNVTVYNNSSDQVGVRLILDGESRTWLFNADQQDTLAKARSQRHAKLELFDPLTCETLAREELPGGPGVVVVASRDFTSDGGWLIDAGNDSAFEATVLEPNFYGCPDEHQPPESQVTFPNAE